LILVVVHRCSIQVRGRCLTLVRLMERRSIILEHCSIYVKIRHG
jgi:hypothetical protein